MTSTRRRDAFALITTLLIILVVAALGVASLALNRNQLSVQRNVSDAAQARNLVASTMDATLAEIEAYYEQHGTLPADADIDPPTFEIDGTPVRAAFQPMPGRETFIVEDDAGTRIEIRIVGQLASGARAIGELVLDAGTGTSRIADGFLGGIQARDAVTINGLGNAELIDVRVHGNRGFDLNGGQLTEYLSTCEDASRTGPCQVTWRVDAANAPEILSAATGQDDYDCKINGAGDDDVCEGTGSRAVPTNRVDDPFAAVDLDGSDAADEILDDARARALCEAGNGGGACTAAQLAAVDWHDYRAVREELCEGFDSNEIDDDELDDDPHATFVCHDGDLDVDDDVDLDGKVLIVDGDMEFDDRDDLEGAVLVTFGGDVTIDDDGDDLSLRDTRIFADGRVRLGSADKEPRGRDADTWGFIGENVSLEGATTVASANSLRFEGDTGRSFATDEDGNAVVAAAVISAGDIEYASRATPAVVFLAGQDIEDAETVVRMYGSLVALGDVKINGASGGRGSGGEDACLREDDDEDDEDDEKREGKGKKKSSDKRDRDDDGDDWDGWDEDDDCETPSRTQGMMIDGGLGVDNPDLPRVGGGSDGLETRAMNIL